MKAKVNGIEVEGTTGRGSGVCAYSYSRSVYYGWTGYIVASDSEYRRRYIRTVSNQRRNNAKMKRKGTGNCDRLRL